MTIHLNIILLFSEKLQWKNHPDVVKLLSQYMHRKGR